MINKATFVLLLVALFPRDSQTGSVCPAAAAIGSCTCSNDLNMMTKVTCDDSNFSRIVKAIEAMSSLRMIIDVFKMKSEGAHRLPPAFFLNTRVTKVQLETPSLVQVDVAAFFGQEHWLKELQIRSSMLDSVPVNAIKYLYALRSFEMLWAPKLNSLPLYMFSSMANASSIEELRIINGNISNIGRGAFEALTNLKVLDLSNNRIGLLWDKYFEPNPAHLTDISFSNNRIEELPVEFLSVFPKNSKVYLEHNRLKTISDACLLHVFHYSLSLLIEGNPINCNCDMKYIGSLNSYVETKIGVDGACANPPSLAGTELFELRKSDFSICYMYRSHFSLETTNHVDN